MKKYNVPKINILVTIVIIITILYIISSKINLFGLNTNKYRNDKKIIKYKIQENKIDNDKISYDRIQPFEYYKKIIDRDLMRTKPPKKIANDSININNSINVNNVNVNLKLWGVFIDTGGNSYAIIEYGGNKDFYTIGDTIQNMTISKIQHDNVTFTSNNSFIVLTIERPESRDIQGK